MPFERRRWCCGCRWLQFSLAAAGFGGGGALEIYLSSADLDKCRHLDEGLHVSDIGVKAMKKYRVHKILGLVMMASSALGVSQAASATVSSATSTGYGVGANLGLLGSPVLDLVLPSGATGTAPGTYNNAAAVLGADANVGIVAGLLGLNVSSGAAADAVVIGANASSDVDGNAGNRLTSASSNIDQLDVGLGIVVGGAPLATLVDLSNVTLSSTANVMGDYGTMSASGGADIISGELNLAALLGLGNPLSLDLSVYAGAAPNTQIAAGLLNPLGISLVLNEQIENCSAAFCSFEANALHLILDAVDIDASLLGLVGATLNLDVASLDLTLGHSYAEMSAVPVPAAAWLFGSGILGLVGFGRRRQVQVVG